MLDFLILFFMNPNDVYIYICVCGGGSVCVCVCSLKFIFKKFTFVKVIYVHYLKPNGSIRLVTTEGKVPALQ